LPQSDTSSVAAAVAPPSAPAPAASDADQDATPQAATVVAAAVAPPAEQALVAPELAAPTSSLDLSQYQPALDFVVATPIVPGPIVQRRASVADAWPPALDTAAAAAALPQTGRERDDRHAANAAGSDLRVRFDRRARLLDAAEWQDVRQSTWQQNWVSGRDAHVARKNADWRVVVSRV
jgi:hypothetical protein